MPDPKEEPKKTGNNAVDGNIIEILAENERLKTVNAQQTADLKTTRDSLKVANDLLEAQTKGVLIEEIRARSDFGVEELSGMTCDELRNTRNHLKRIKGVMLSSGDLGGGKPMKRSLDDLYGQGWKNKVT